MNLMKTKLYTVIFLKFFKFSYLPISIGLVNLFFLMIYNYWALKTAVFIFFTLFVANLNPLAVWKMRGNKDTYKNTNKQSYIYSLAIG